MKEQNGGPAFPQPCTDSGHVANSAFEVAGGGMTLRDYFASHAPHAPAEWFDFQWDGTPEQAIELSVRWRWVYADAMLAARENGGAA